MPELSILYALRLVLYSTEEDSELWEGTRRCPERRVLSSLFVSLSLFLSPSVLVKDFLTVSPPLKAKTPHSLPAFSVCTPWGEIPNKTA